MSRKLPPPMPVVGQTEDGAREEALRAWEAEQLALRQQQAAPPAATPAAVVPAPAVEVSTAPAVSEGSPKYLPMPQFTEPDSDDPADRLAHYSRGIFAAQYAARANHERAEQQKLISLGLHLRAIKKEELHKLARFDTFGDLVEARFGFKKHQANNILRVMGVVQALEGVTTQELKPRPLNVLVYVLDNHGADAVRATWAEAARHGNVTEESLRQAANFLGYSPPKALEAEKKALPAPAPAMLKESTAAVLRLRTLAEKDPGRARREVIELQKAIDDLVAQLPEDEAAG